MEVKIKYNDSLLDKLGIFIKIGGITLFPYIILREYYLSSNYINSGRTKRTLNHEFIHIEQQKEMLVIFFYLWYSLEYVFRVFQYRNFNKAYRNISFEREAYTNQENYEYLDNRSKWDFIKYLII